MIGLDCNILVQLAFADHPSHTLTVSALETQTQAGEKLVIVPLVITEFLHISTDARRFSPPLTMSEAIDWTQEFLANPSVVFLEPSLTTIEQSLRWLRQFNLGRKRILDTHLAAVLHTNGVTRLLTSNPGDFGIFGVLEIITP
jgi:predicted nucleic acid-binding protein